MHMHILESLKVYAITAAVFIVLWSVCWYVWLGPWLTKYNVITGLESRIAGVESFPGKVLVWLEAKKTLIVAFVMSIFAAAKGATDTAVSTVSGLGGTDIAPLQDKSIWSAFFGDIWTLHIMAALSLLAAFLTLKGKVTAAAITPVAGTTASGAAPASTPPA